MKNPRSRILIAAGAGIALVLAGIGALVGPSVLGGPRVIATSPPDGELAANPQAPIIITLSQPPQASALSQITLDPPTPFTASVDGNDVRIVPQGELRYDSDYRLTIAGLRNWTGRGMDAPLTISFHTVPYTTVREFGPPQNASDVPLRGPITVAFAGPVVSSDLVAAIALDPRQADQLPQPLTLAPANAPDQPVPGVGRWLAPDLFGFYPSEDLRAATAYNAVVQVAVSGDGRAQLAQPVSWTFTTAAPLLTGTRPFEGETDVAPASAIEVRLASDVDIAAAAKAFALRPASGGSPIDGAIEPLDGGFIFRPAQPLATGTRYAATLMPGIPSRFGAPLNPDARSWEFTTIGDPEVLQVEPLPDSSEVITVTSRISVRFNHPIVALTDVTNQQALPQPITIDPPLQGVGLWLDTSTYVFSPTIGLEPSTTYRAAVAAGLSDKTGGTLQQEYRWSFTTIQPMATGSIPNYMDAAPSDTIKIFFNQPIDPADAAKLQLVRASGEPVAGSFRTVRSEAIFTPGDPLERGVTYRLLVPAGVRSANGRGATAQPYEGIFRIAPLPAIIESTPASGDRAVDPYESLRLVFSTEMNWDTVEPALSIDPRPTDLYTSTYENELYVYFSLIPETDYTVTLAGAAADRFGVPIGSDTTIRFRTAPLDPSLMMLGVANRIGAYNAYADTRVPIQVVNIDQASYRLSRLQPEQVVNLSADYDAWVGYTPTPDTVLREGILPTPGDRNQARIALLDLGRLDAGLYLLEANAGDDGDRQILSVSPYALTVKRSADQIFIWAVDLASGKPVADLNLQSAVYDYQKPGVGTPKTIGRTGGDGVLRAPIDSSDVYNTLYLWSPGASPAAFITTDWNNGINPWDFGEFSEFSLGGLYGSLTTDRPIYRPDQQVHIRGIVRVREPGGPSGLERYRTPAGEQATLFVNDPEGNSVLTRTLTLSEFGTFSADLPLDQGAPLGGYSIVASLNTLPDATVFGTFTVAEYRKPTFEIGVTPSATDVVQGDRLTASVAARYFAGGALGNAPLRWRLLAEPLGFYPEDLPDFRFDNYDDADLWYDASGSYGGATLIGDGEATTDAQGNFVLTIPADLYAKATDSQGGASSASARTLTIDVEVTDVDGQVIASQARVQVHPAAFYIGLRPAGYVVKAGEPQKVALITVTPQGDPVPGRALSVEVFQREWFSARERGDDGRLYWTSSYTDTLVQTIPATTDAQGRAEISFTPAVGGSYRLQASGKDDGGHVAASSAFTWAYGGDLFWGVDDTNRVDLIADKRSYRPGETAKVLVTAPYPGMTALVTLERGEVIEHRQITLAGTTELIEVPITADHAPNVYFSMVLLKTACAAQASAASPCPEVPDLRVGLINLIVSTEQQELNVTITPDKQEAGPRDTLTYTIKTTDAAGAGVRSEVGLALVDKAVLSLADDPNPSLRNAFYSRRGLGIQTSQSLTALVDRVTIRLQPGDKGGGGAEGEAASVRREFPDTAYWNPSVVTGADGTAQVTVELPDSLTTWRMAARAVTTDTRVGQATSDIVATRPLFVRPALPRFLTAGDAPTLQAVVQNGTDAAIDATVTLEVTGDQAAALTLDTPASQTVQVPSGSAVVVRWPAHLATTITPGAISLRLQVEGGGQRDSVEASLPLRRFETPEVVATAGQVYDLTVETIQPPSDRGRLDIEAVPSLAAGVYSGLDALRAFAYDCTEQTVSKFLPNAVTYRLLKQAGRDDPQLRAALEQSLAVGSQRLAALQNLDGGWGWWESEESNPFITIYVVHGLVEAQRAGFMVDARLLSGGIDYLDRALDGDLLAVKGRAGVEDARAYALFVLAEAGRADRGRAVALFEDRSRLQVYGRAYLLMALQGAGGEDARVKALVGELMNRAILTTTEAHWEEPQIDYWTMSSNTRSTALAMQALVRADPQNFLVPNATRYLMGLRDHGAWQTTQETTFSAIALAEYAAASGELSPDYRYTIAAGGQQLREGQVTSANLTEQIQIGMPLTDLGAAPGGEAQLTFTKEGAGRLYYTIRMRSYLDAAAVKPLDRGIAVEREYMAVAADTLTSTGKIVSGAQLGEVVQVRLTIRVPDDLTYVAVEDMLPAGLEALDASLKTVSAVAQEGELEDSADLPFWWFISRATIRDDRVALFATNLESGTYTYTYLARATTPGVFQTLPTTIYQMYAPEVFGRSAGATFTVTAPAP